MRPPSVRVACIQVNATDHLVDNLACVTDLIRSAVSDGAQFVLTPENVCMMTWGREKSWQQAHVFEGHPVIQALSALAAEYGIWLLIGSVSVRLSHQMLANRSVLVDPNGQIKVTYDKIHMFDVSLANGEQYRESAQFMPGNQAQVVDTIFGRIGLSICYDVRFPGLYRTLAQQGAVMLTVPAAFTRTTGAAHWHTLLRARAIETGCYVLAPGQTGTHEGGRQTYGHSLIVDPWGTVLADAGPDVGYIISDLDLSRVPDVRASIPSLSHDRPFKINISETEIPQP